MAHPRACRSPDGHSHLTDPHAPDAAARRDGPARHRRAAGAEQRPAPVRVPARALAGPRLAVGLHRLDGHAGGGHASAPRCSPTAATGCRPKPSSQGTGIELVRIHSAAVARAPGLAGRAGAARRQRRGRRPGAGPGRGAGAEGAARRRRHRAAHRARCARRHLARPPRACPRSRCMRTARRMRRGRAPPSWRWCARRWRGTARRTTSSPPSTTSPG